MSNINFIKKPIAQLTVEFNGKTWRVLELSKEKNSITLESCFDNKIITRSLDNTNILVCGY